MTRPSAREAGAPAYMLPGLRSSSSGEVDPYLATIGGGRAEVLAEQHLEREREAAQEREEKSAREEHRRRRHRLQRILQRGMGSRKLTEPEQNLIAEAVAMFEGGADPSDVVAFLEEHS